MIFDEGRDLEGKIQREIEVLQMGRDALETLGEIDGSMESMNVSLVDLIEMSTKTYETLMRLESLLTRMLNRR